MTALGAIAHLFGWRGAMGVVLGAMLSAVPAYELGAFREAATADEHVARVLAERDTQQMGIEDARVDAAAKARIAADHGAFDSSMPDDGYRRD